MKTGRPVLVMQLPTRLNLSEAREFLPEVMCVLKNDRPHIVFDFSEVQQIDSAGVEMLLKCLERVMSLDGDLKLAALTPQASVILELTRVDRFLRFLQPWTKQWKVSADSWCRRRPTCECMVYGAVS